MPLANVTAICYPTENCKSTLVYYIYRKSANCIYTKYVQLAASALSYYQSTLTSTHFPKPPFIHMATVTMSTCATKSSHMGTRRKFVRRNLGVGVVEWEEDTDSLPGRPKSSINTHTGTQVEVFPRRLCETAFVFIFQRAAVWGRASEIKRRHDKFSSGVATLCYSCANYICVSIHSVLVKNTNQVYHGVGDWV